MKTRVTELILILAAMFFGGGTSWWLLRGRSAGKSGASQAPLSFADQLKRPHEFVRIESGENLLIEFKTPVLTMDDVAKIGLLPSRQDTVGDNTEWIYDITVPRPNATPRRIHATVSFRCGKLARIVIPGSVARFISSAGILDYCRVLGHANLEFSTRRLVKSNTAPAPDFRLLQFPDSEECHDIFGAPYQEYVEAKLKVLSYRLQIERPGTTKSRPIIGRLYFRNDMESFQYGILSFGSCSLVFSPSDIFIQV